MIDTIKEVEPERDALLGQVWTPEDIAIKMAKTLAKHCPSEIDLLIDPASGPGTFTNAIRDEGLFQRVKSMRAFDIDDRFVNLNNSALSTLGTRGTFEIKDYLKTSCFRGCASAIIMNPPYIRQEQIDISKKRIYQEYLRKRTGFSIDGRSNLFAYFMLKAIDDLAPDGILCCIVYSAISHSLYGKRLLNHIKTLADIIEITRIDTPFENVLVDADILVIRKRSKQQNVTDNSIPISCNDQCSGLAPVKELAEIKRGIGLLSSKLFLADPSDEYFSHATKIIKKRARFAKTVIGTPEFIDPVYLYSTLDNTPQGFPTWIANRVKQAQDAGGRNLTTVTRRLDSNSPEWFLHKSYTSPIIFNYYIRDRIRHIRNIAKAQVSDNFYGITPRDLDPDIAWLILNSKTALNNLHSAGRPQGNGLVKLQLYEYEQANIPDWRLIPSQALPDIKKLAVGLIHKSPEISELKEIAEKVVQKYIF